MPSVQKLKNELRLLTDVPSEEIVFGFNEYADTLASAIMGSQPQLTVGIFGSWGCGKATLLNRVKKHLQSSYEDKALVVFFDAWRYQHEQHMLIALLETILNGLRAGKQQWKVFGNKLENLSKAFMEALTVKVPGIEVKVRDAINTLKQTKESQSIYYNWLSELQTAIGAARKSDHSRRIVILIDELDRCLPNKVIEVLESIKVLMDVPGFVFVIAVDQQIVERTAANHHDIRDRDYLKKLVQVEFRLPPLRSEDVRNYTGSLCRSLGHGDDEVSLALAAVVPSVIGDNPRDVKRFINSVLLGTSIMSKAGVNVSLTVQVAFMAMDFRWPGLVRILSVDLTLLEQIARFDEAKVQGLKTQRVVEKANLVKTLLQNNPGLDSFLSDPVGAELLSLRVNELNQLLFYSSLVKVTGKEEKPEDIVDNILLTLKPLEHRVASLLFGLEDGQPHSYTEVGKEFNLTRERTRQIVDVTLRKLRHPSRSRHLRIILGSMSGMDTRYQNLLLSIFGSEWQKYATGESK